MAGSSEPAFYLSAKKGAIAQSPIYFLVILRQPLIFSILVIFFLSPLNASASSTSSFLFFLSCHDLDDRFIRLTHSLLCKLSNITDRVFYTFFYKSVSAIELLSIFLHLKSQKSCFYS